MTPVMRADREMQRELAAATSEMITVYIFHRKMVELTAKEFLLIREFLLTIVSKLKNPPSMYIYPK